MKEKLARRIEMYINSNFLKGDLDKYRILPLGSRYNNNVNIVIDGEVVVSTDCLKLLSTLMKSQKKQSTCGSLHETQKLDAYWYQVTIV